MKGKVDDRQLGKSSMYNTNNNGPNMLPYRTPDVTITECDSVLFMCT